MPLRTPNTSLDPYKTSQTLWRLLQFPLKSPVTIRIPLDLSITGDNLKMRISTLFHGKELLLEKMKTDFIYVKVRQFYLKNINVRLSRVLYQQTFVSTYERVKVIIIF